MALTPLADENGDVLMDADGNADPAGEFSFQSVGDPALDRILLRCHAIETKVRRVSADVKRIKDVTDHARWIAWGLVAIGGFAMGIGIIDFLSRP